MSAHRFLNATFTPVRPAGRRPQHSGRVLHQAPLRWRALIAALVLAVGVPGHTQESAPPALGALVQALGRIENPEAQANILRGMNASLKGQRGATVPAGWPALYEKLKASPSEEVREQAQALAAALGGGAALDGLRKILADAHAKPEARLAALDSLLAAKDAPTLPVLLDLVKAPGPLRTAALRGLAAFDDARIPAQILAVYPTLDAAEKQDALGSLLARAASARALLAAIDAKTLDRAAITAPLARQLQGLRDAAIEAWLAKNWGAVRATTEDTQKQIATFKKFLTTDSILRANAARGRGHFQQACALCHSMFGEGAKVGPDLPGSFEDVDYLLQNIVDPNATIGKDYQQAFVETKDGRILTGILATDDASGVTLKTLAGPATVPRADIKSVEVSPNSLMPAGLLNALDEDGVRDLFLYLRQRQQVPPPAPR